MGSTLQLGDDRDLPPFTGQLTRAALEQVEAAPGDIVRLGGTDGTAVRLATDVVDGDTPVLSVGRAVRERLGRSVGDRVAVERFSPAAAEAVTVAPRQRFRVHAGPDAVRRLLADRPVSRGDRFFASLLGGSITLPFSVVETRPAGPVVVTEETDLEVRDSPVADATDAGDGTTPEATAEDVGGLADTLDRLRRAVVPLRQPELARRFGGRLPNGLLLTGPTGTGKTLLVEALASELDATFLRVEDPEVVRGSGDSGLEDVVRRARADAPSLVFFDDLDVLAPSREDGSGTAARGTARVVRAVDRLAGHEGVVVVGATNRVDAVDAALRRGGRFDRELEVGVPDRDGRLEILRIHTREVPLAADVDLPTVADATHGFVGADLAALVSEAVDSAVSRVPAEHLSGPDPVPGEVLGDAAVTGADFERALEAVAPRGLQGAALERPDVGYEDIGGLESVKTELVRAVEWPLLYPELFETLRSSAPSGILLYGPPGTGKTMLARAVANSTDANFLAVNGPELLNRYVGESERGVRDVFQRARRHAPTVVFFDEVDAIATTRREDSSSGVVERVVSQLLTELDGVRDREGVVVVAATNRPDMVDPALLRPGRLEKAIEVPMPDRDARRAIFEVHTREVPLGEDVDLSALADRTEGLNGSDVAAVVREASLRAMERYLRTHGFTPDETTLPELRVGTADFEAALESVSPSVPAERREYDGEFEDPAE